MTDKEGNLFWYVEYTIWAHSSMDKYRHLGKDFNLEKIKNGVNSFDPKTCK
jgi:hypothetical protein